MFYFLTNCLLRTKENEARLDLLPLDPRTVLNRSNTLSIDQIRLRMCIILAVGLALF